MALCRNGLGGSAMQRGLGGVLLVIFCATAGAGEERDECLCPEAFPPVKFAYDHIPGHPEVPCDLIRPETANAWREACAGPLLQSICTCFDGDYIPTAQPIPAAVPIYRIERHYVTRPPEQALPLGQSTSELGQWERRETPEEPREAVEMPPATPHKETSWPSWLSWLPGLGQLKLGLPGPDSERGFVPQGSGRDGSPPARSSAPSSDGGTPSTPSPPSPGPGAGAPSPGPGSTPDAPGEGGEDDNGDDTGDDGEDKDDGREGRDKDRDRAGRDKHRGGDHKRGDGKKHDRYQSERHRS